LCAPFLDTSEYYLLTLDPANLQDAASPLLHSDKAFEYYLQALLKAKKEASINPAVRRRESLLAAHPITAPSPPPLQEVPSGDTTTPTQEPVSPAPPQDVSRSQQIASSVLAGTSVESPTPGLGSPGQLSPDMAKLFAALTAGQGGSGNPVHVVIKERES
jgi:ATP-dependent metalloprotease